MEKKIEEAIIDLAKTQSECIKEICKSLKESTDIIRQAREETHKKFPKLFN